MSTGSFLTQGNDINEANWSAHNRALLIGAPHVHVGFEITDGGGLNATVGDGVAMVNGKRVESDGDQTVVVADDDGSYIWLEPDGTLTDETAGTDPGSSLLLGLVIASGGSIDSIDYARNIGLDPDGTRQANRCCVFIKKLADESVTASTATQLDDELQFTVLDGEVWDVTVLLDVAQLNATPDFKARLQGGDGSKFHLGSSGIDGAIHGEFDSFLTSDLITQMTSVSAGNPIFMRSTVHATSNTTLGLRWAQGTSNGNATTVKAGSVMIARRLVG